MMKKMNCPSAPFKKGHLIFAFFQDNSFQFIEDPINIDDRMVSAVEKDDDKTNYRATMPFVTRGCRNWDGEKCTVPDQMRYYLRPLQDSDIQSSCPI